jgi:hypothetical protein
MNAVDRDLDEDSQDSVDHLIVSLRAYVTRAPTKAKKSKGEEKPGQRPAGKKQFPPRIPPSDWVLVFDCETRTTPDQRLRFGAYQFRNKGRLFERGAFYEPEVLSAKDLTVLSKVLAEELETSDGERVRLLTRAQFVDQVLYGSGRDVGAQIVGFNLPFDISRLAIDHDSARRSMRGGFTFKLSEKEGRANVVVKHLSQKAALIRFAGEKPEKAEDETEETDPDTPHESEVPADPDRGYFVDLKTLAAALTGGSHSLASLSALLDVPTKKTESDEHGGPLTPDYVRYGLRDVQTTWECFDALAQRFATFGLNETGCYDLYSEASIGKAYLKTMKIARWRDLQPNFPPQMIGQILSAYFGGRAEVHIRRQIVPVIHCDFLSMYPTVCTLMGLWNFVRARGVIYREDTERVRALIETPREELAELLRHKPVWSGLTALVQVAPNRDLFPVRAKYPDAETANIGLNELSSDDPFWFTFADVLAAKVLTGRTPTILKAIRFEPKGKQAGLKPVVVAGETIDPTTQDFYRQLIIHRNKLKAEAKLATGAKKAALESDQQAIKILANATSYGIFVELNVEDYKTAKTMIANGAEGQPFKFRSKSFEKPGQYFHPLLGTLITGAARLMLALAERRVQEEGLDWAFCDTDSIAIANVGDLPLEQFKAKALRVHGWFEDLNPYGERRSILQLEKVNFPPGRDGDLAALDPPLCFAVSAKRYVLFNRKDGQPIIRKASGHGLGHLLAPYDEPPKQRRGRVKRIGVPLWQEDLWKEVIRAAESETPDQARFLDMKGFDAPAASPYAATTPELLRWFKSYNEQQKSGERIFPFGFLLSLQAKSRPQMAKDEPEALSDGLWRRRDPRPAAPYFNRATEAAEHAFDRERGSEVPASWLKSHGRSLVRYHLHPESKFRGGDYDQHGALRRRHVIAFAVQAIGKESDDIEENEFIGEDAGPAEHPMAFSSSAKVAAFVAETQQSLGTSDRELLGRAKVSPHSLKRLRAGKRVGDDLLHRLATAAERLRLEHGPALAEREKWLHIARELMVTVGGRNKLAAVLGVDGSYLGRVVGEKKPMTAEMIERLKAHCGWPAPHDRN